MARNNCWDMATCCIYRRARRCRYECTVAWSRTTKSIGLWSIGKPKGRPIWCRIFSAPMKRRRRCWRRRRRRGRQCRRIRSAVRPSRGVRFGVAPGLDFGGPAQVKNRLQPQRAYHRSHGNGRISQLNGQQRTARGHRAKTKERRLKALVMAALSWAMVQVSTVGAAAWRTSVGSCLQFKACLPASVSWPGIREVAKSNRCLGYLTFSDPI